MKSKNKSLFLCVVALFVIAVLLIVVSSVQQLKIQPSSYLNDEQEQVYSSALQQNAAQLVEESDRIKEENEKLKKSLEEKEAELAGLHQDLQQYQQSGSNSEFLVESATKFINAHYSESLEFLQNVNVSILSAQEKDLYNQLFAALSIKGFDVESMIAQ